MDIDVKGKNWPGILACGLLVTVLLATPDATARFGLGTIEFLTFRAPVGLPGVTLVAGKYSFEVAHVDGREVVRVRYRRTNRITYEGVTQRVERPKGFRPQDCVLLSEAQPGEVAKILAWFPLNEAVGYAFVYDGSSQFKVQSLSDKFE